VNAGDHVVISYSGVTNPDVGEYEIVFVVNPQSDGTQSNDTLTIGGTSSTTDTPAGDDDAATPTATTDSNPTTRRTDGDDSPDRPADTETADDGKVAPGNEDPADGEETVDKTAAGTPSPADTGADPTSETAGAEDRSDWDGAGPGLVGAVVAVLAAALLARG
jgi:septal ring-binding cell division protein DamX